LRARRFPEISSIKIIDVCGTEGYALAALHQALSPRNPLKNRGRCLDICPQTSTFVRNGKGDTAKKDNHQRLPLRYWHSFDLPAEERGQASINGSIRGRGRGRDR
jgi:hypothetical protein